MLKTLLATLFGAGTTLFISKYKTKWETNRQDYQFKRDNLKKVYTKLLSVINLYPTESPNDILKYIEHAPRYSMEHFDSILKSLDYQIEDYKNQLNSPSINYQRKNNIDAQISNREYGKEKIIKIRDKYHKACDKYKDFCESEKVVFELYAGEDVKHCLANFEAIIHNVFISGRSEGEADDPRNNRIIISREILINSMRNDLRISRNI